MHTQKKMRDEGMICNESGMIVENGTRPCYDLWSPQRIKDGLTLRGDNKTCMAMELKERFFCEKQNQNPRIEWRVIRRTSVIRPKGTWTSCAVSNEQCPRGCMIATPDSPTVIGMFSDFDKRAREAERQGAVIRQDGPRDIRQEGSQRAVKELTTSMACIGEDGRVRSMLLVR